MPSIDSPYKIVEPEVYNVYDNTSSAYQNQRQIDLVNAQAQQNAIGDKMPTPTISELTVGPIQKGSGEYLAEYRIKINNKGYHVIAYNENEAIQKVFKKNNSTKEYLISCNDVLYKGKNGKFVKLYN